MSRTWVYQTLLNDTRLAELVGDRIFQGESMDGAPATKPFVIYRFGNSSPDNGYRLAERQYFTIYMHDEGQPGTYDLIDKIRTEVMRIFEEAPAAPEYKIVEARYLETSSDQDDREMGTVLRYSRFQLIYSSRKATP